MFNGKFDYRGVTYTYSVYEVDTDFGPETGVTVFLRGEEFWSSSECMSSQCQLAMFREAVDDGYDVPLPGMGRAFYRDSRPATTVGPKCDGCGKVADLEQRNDFPAIDGRAPMMCDACVRFPDEFDPK